MAEYLDAQKARDFDSTERLIRIPDLQKVDRLFSYRIAHLTEHMKSNSDYCTRALPVW